MFTAAAFAFLQRRARRFVACLAIGCALAAQAAAPPVRGPLGLVGAEATYRPETTAPPRATTVGQFTVLIGATDASNPGAAQWLRLQAIKANGERFAVWTLAAAYPARDLANATRQIRRYLLQEGERPAREFVEVATGAAVLPTSGAWEWLWPRPVPGEPERDGFATAVDLLGHRYRLESAMASAQPTTPPAAQIVRLRPGALIGVPSNSRTQEDARRFDGSDYPMVRLTRDDYAQMIAAGMNCLHVDAEQLPWIENEPVFHWGVSAAEARFPECLYRSTYLGPALFLDEPAVGTRDHDIRPRLEKEPALRRQINPALMFQAFRDHYHNAVQKGAPTALVAGLQNRADIDPGTLRFAQANLYSWETMIASAAWQLTGEPVGGPAAIVFEPPGRLGTRRTLPEMNMAYGCQLPVEPGTLQSILFAWLRGAARASGREWGVSIYGAVEQADAPGLLTGAYDAGARYFFYWDNYQLACVPWSECLALTRRLSAHIRSHPDRDEARLKRAAEVLLLLPPGYDLGHTHMGRGNLWGLGELNLERTNGCGVRYRQVMSNAFVEIERGRRLGIAFDARWDLPGLPTDGYREVLRMREDGGVERSVNGGPAVRFKPRPPGRPAGEAPALSVELPNGQAGPARSVTARARVREGSAPVYYTHGTDRDGVYRNARVLWELYGPAPEDYRQLVGRRGPSDPTGISEVQFRLEQPGHYRLRAATTDLAGRSAVVWKAIEVSP